MGWTPGKSSGKIDMGEMPHKGIISAIEEANLDKYAPEHLGTHAKISKAIAAQRDAVGQDILQDQHKVDIATWLDELKENHDGFGDGPDVFKPDFLQELDKHVKADARFKFDEVLTLVYRRELMSPMFYFGIAPVIEGKDMDYVDADYYVVVTPIPLWGDDKRIDDEGLANYVVPVDLLSELQESYYEATDKTITASKMRKKLIALGFVENHEVAGL